MLGLFHATERGSDDAHLDGLNTASRSGVLPGRRAYTTSLGARKRESPTLGPLVPPGMDHQSAPFEAANCRNTQCYDGLGRCPAPQQRQAKSDLCRTSGFPMWRLWRRLFALSNNLQQASAAAFQFANLTLQGSPGASAAWLRSPGRPGRLRSAACNPESHESSKG